MKVRQLMKAGVWSCRKDESLKRAAKIMWENDCGCVVVMDETGRPIGMLTDRDICMAAYFQDAPLRLIRISSAMSAELFCCAPDDSVAAAEATMRNRQVRRLPVVAGGEVVGMLSLNDIVGEADRERTAKRKEVTFGEVGKTLGAVCAPRARQLSIVA